MAKTDTSRSAGSKKTTTTSSFTRRPKMLSVSLLRGEPAGARGADIRSATLDEIKGMKRRGELYPTRPDAEEIELDESFWRNAELIMPGEKPKSSVHLRINHDVLDWFKSKGKGHLTRMSSVLRAYYLANRKKKAS